MNNIFYSTMHTGSDFKVVPCMRMFSVLAVCEVKVRLSGLDQYSMTNVVWLILRHIM